MTATDEANQVQSEAVRRTLEVNGSVGYSAMNRLHATEFHVLCILHNKSNFKRREQPKRFACETPT